MVDPHIVDCDFAERDTDCACNGGLSLDILKDVQRAYEDRMEAIERNGGGEKLNRQVAVLRSWVSDLVAQNTLLARAVEQLEMDATTSILERRRHAEMEVELRAEARALRRRLSRKDSDVRGLLEVLRRLREFDNCTLGGIRFFEVTESDIFGSVDWRSQKILKHDRMMSKRKWEQELNASTFNFTSRDL